MIALDWIDNAITVCAIVIGTAGVVAGLPRVVRDWQYQSLRKVFGFSKGDRVLVVCSELANPAARQNPEPREYSYHRKYGDLDALIEVVTTVCCLFPRIKMRLVSPSDFKHTRTTLGDCHVICIGGPDYNSLVERMLREQFALVDYRSPYSRVRSTVAPDEITLYRNTDGREYFCLEGEEDWGYVEIRPSPWAQEKRLILFGGPHSLGVTGIAKSLSCVGFSDDHSRGVIVRNARFLRKCLRRTPHVAVIVKVFRIESVIVSARLFDGHAILITPGLPGGSRWAKV